MNKNHVTIQSDWEQQKPAALAGRIAEKRRPFFDAALGLSPLQLHCGGLPGPELRQKAVFLFSIGRSYE